MGCPVLCQSRQRKKGSETMRTTYFFMGRKDSKPRTSGFVLIGSPQSPECNWPATKLRKPTFEFRLCSVVRETTHVKNLASLGKKSTNVSSGIHRAAQNIGMFMRGLRFAN